MANTPLYFVMDNLMWKELCSSLIKDNQEMSFLIIWFN